MQPGPPALGARSLGHWTTREVPNVSLFFKIKNWMPSLTLQEQRDVTGLFWHVVGATQGPVGGVKRAGRQSSPPGLSSGSLCDLSPGSCVGKCQEVRKHQSESFPYSGRSLEV